MTVPVPPPRSATAQVLAQPGAFALRVLRGFRANQGLLLAGAVAYYALLSLAPLLILVMIVLSNAIEPGRLLAVLTDYLAFVVPGSSAALVDELRRFIEHRHVIGGVLLVTLVFFSALAFTVVENAMSVIFFHRVAIRRRHFLVSALIPYLFVLLLGVGFLVVTVVSGALESLATRNVQVLGHSRSLEGVSTTLLYLIGVGGEILMLTSIYLVMPVGQLSFRHALAGGIVAGLLWEFTRHVLVWYYAKVSQIQVVYGSMTTAIVVLLSVEFAAIVLLLGAQVIAEYERIGREPIDAPPAPLQTESPRSEGSA
ncbi:MAG TPA: YihY/virulence factor BrkB family protein [Burkholderiales bacterium]|nr:YihY/virulence factor BrkB family protein [Burkholderiales bacterium]